MTPKAAYDDTASRANRLLRLHDGLINRRRYGIRSDWKRLFCTLMHWPQADVIDRVDTSSAIIVIKHGADLTRQDFTADSLDDLLRSALTFGVSALDRYVHERIVRNIVQALGSSRLTRRQKEFSIPAVLALRITREAARACRENRRVRPANEVRRKVQEILHTRTFQSWQELADAFELLGVTNLAGQLQSAYRTGNIQPVRNQLNTLVRRRNIIVHEGDLVRHERGGQVRRLAISRQYVSKSLAFLNTLVTHLETVN